MKLGLYNVDHMSDSSLMCNVLNDKSTTTQYRLHEVSKSVTRIKQVCREEGGRIYHTHVTRNRNTMADAEANAAMDTCQPVPEAWNQGCDSDVYPTAEQTRAWKPMQPYPAPDVGRPDTVRDTNHIPPTNFRGYHTEMNEDTKACLKWFEE